MIINDSIMHYSEKIIFTLRKLFLDNGFTPYRMSRFEEYDLYANNKEFLISDNVITFTGAGGKLMALKPDVTLSIIKNSKDEPDALQKVFYSENVYRYSKEAGTFKEIMQIGAETFGTVDLDTVADTILIAAESLKFLTDNFIIAISNLDIIKYLVSEITDNADTAEKLLFAVSKKDNAYLSQFNSNVAEMALLCRLVDVHDSVKSVISKLKPIFREVNDTAQCKDFIELLNALSKSEFADKIFVDFSVTDDMNYYNGTVFKGYVNGVAGATLSGGQYDKLMKKMGKRSKAVGFAIYTDKLEGIDGNRDNITADKDFVNIAIPKGRLGEKVFEILTSTGINCPTDINDNRKLIFEDKDSRVRFFWVKPTDVAKYVEKGAADIGVAGKDILLEYEPDVYELCDLKIGVCKMAVAAPKGFCKDTDKTLRVATKFENIATRYYQNLGKEIEVIHLNGSIEVAPILGLSDVIVDIVETGKTLKENNLEVIDDVLQISARLIANKTSFKFKNDMISQLVMKISAVTEGKS